MLTFPSVIGHRGNRKEYGYENTIPALQFAIDHADGFETDIVLSADGSPCIVHDTYFGGDYTEYELNSRLDEESKKLVNNRRMDQMTLEEIAALKLVDGSPIPTMSDVDLLIASAPDKLINLELKAPYSGKAVASKISRRDNLFLSSFNHLELTLVREQSDVPIGVLYEPSNVAGAPMYSWLPSEPARYIPFSIEHIRSSRIRALKPDYIGLNEYDLRPDVLAAILDIHPDVLFYIWYWYTETEPERNNRLIQTLYQLARENLLDKMVAIVTDYPSAMKTLFQKIGS